MEPQVLPDDVLTPAVSCGPPQVQPGLAQLVDKGEVAGQADVPLGHVGLH